MPMAAELGCELREDEAMIEKTEARSLLEKERQRVVRILGWSSDALLAHEKPSVSEAMPQSGDDEMADTATDTFEQELDEAVSRRFHDKLLALDAALKRLEIGEYGICMRCGREISEARLRAIPETPYCIDCGRETESLG